ncbi:L-asparaginase [Limnohabitans parvus II-B4]|uniref:L-asparaginase n=1 Tax=Limnohabitans parvus II-B4 TaxID=1293052 RepID=A0A315EFC7_9BURK|nr:asparaginase [Limnohabitans parvus]PUE55305.1 L-asparaginase [Limnohabitans parvus II-B4]
MQVVEAKKIQKVVVLGTGGTIAGTAASASDHTGYTAGQLGVQHLLDAVPGLNDALQGVALVGEQVAQLDSKDMDHATWQALAQRCTHWLTQPDVGGIVITHGTDTLEETAWFLQQVLHTTKPVVMTCAMRPATALTPDGPQNLLDAMAVVCDPMASGVLAVCAGRIHSARDVQKVHPYRLDAFSSGDAGLRGWVEQGRVRWSNPDNMTEPHPQASQALGLSTADWPWVAVLLSHAGSDARQVQALVAGGVKGLVVAGTGNGTVHQNLLTALAQAQAQGVAVRLTTRCAEGQLVGQAAALPTAPAGLNAHKARVSLMLDLMG